MHGNSQLVSYLVAGVVLALVLLLRLRRTGRMQPLKLERLWILPAIYLVFVVAILIETPPIDSGWIWCAGALLVGAAFGWYRGKTITIRVDPETHALNQATSAASIVFIVGLIAIRFGARTVLADEAASWRLSPTLLVDIFVVLALGLIAMQRLEMFLRAHRLLEAARAGRMSP